MMKSLLKSSSTSLSSARMSTAFFSGLHGLPPSVGALLRRHAVPLRYRYGTFSRGVGAAAVPYTADHARAAAWRAPLWLLLAWAALVPHTGGGEDPEHQASFPLVGLVSVLGPSMIPTMSPDGSDVFLAFGGFPFRWLGQLGLPGGWPRTGAEAAVGDLVGIQVPSASASSPSPTVSCKRVVGVEGDQVRRFGEYVHLFLSQDPDGLGIAWPPEDEHQRLDPTCPWDPEFEAERRGVKERDPHRTFTVPPGHVWVEGDCPGLSVDSRHYGPVPLEAIRGRVVAKLWPLPRTEWRRRPHPIPVDDDTLRQHNVHRVTTKPSSLGL
jgi:signal peptidase I